MAAIKTVDLNDDVILISLGRGNHKNGGKRNQALPPASKGVIVMRLDEEARVVSLVTTPKEDDEQPEGEKPQPQRCEGDEEDETDNNETVKTEEQDGGHLRGKPAANLNRKGQALCAPCRLFQNF